MRPVLAVLLVLPVLLAGCLAGAGNSGGLAVSKFETPPKPEGLPEHLREAKVAPGERTLIARLFSVGDDCTPVLPMVDFLDGPEKGLVQPVIAAIEITDADPVAGDCVGKRATGVEVYYTPATGASGDDMVSFAFRIGEGGYVEVINITVEGDEEFAADTPTEIDPEEVGVRL